MMQEPLCEQTGFLSEGSDGADLNLRMAGGEFCGNASMSAAVWYCIAHGLSGRQHVLLHVSGTSSGVAVTADAPDDSGAYHCTVQMPDAAEITEVSLPYHAKTIVLPLIRFDGISHLILSRAIPRGEAEKLIRIWCGTLHASGLGLMLLDRNAMRLTPLVYIPGADTLFWENSCASGSTAAGIYLSHEAGTRMQCCFAQPAGNLTVAADPDGHAPLLSGTVRFEHSGILLM